MIEPQGTVFRIGCIREKANALIVRELKRRGVQGLVPSHGSLLFQLLQEGSLSLNTLAERVQRSVSTVTVLVDKLEENGYLQRRRSESDRRVTLVSLTEPGRSLSGSFLEISRTLEERVLRNLTREEVSALDGLLERILENLREGERVSQDGERPLSSR